MSPEGWMVELHLGFHYLTINDLQRTIEEYRIFGRVLGVINSTFMALIPKN